MHLHPDEFAPRKRARRALPAIDLMNMPDTTACTTKQVHQGFGFAEITLKKWRREGKGPRVTLIEGRPRYLVRDLREWSGITR